jgi:hypothetical protein
MNNGNECIQEIRVIERETEAMRESLAFQYIIDSFGSCYQHDNNVAQ